jgi:serine phosphatase RsbU (regulator of sigma subunit)
MRSDRGGLDDERLLAGLLLASRRCSLDELAGLVARHAALAGFHDSVIYLLDRQQEVLRPLLGDGVQGRQVVGEFGVDSTLAGRVFRNAETAEARTEAGESATGPVDPADHWLWVPLLNGIERLGVLGMRVHTVDEAVLARAERLAALVALLVVSRRSQSDTYARLTRTKEMTLAAEMQWTLLPPLTFANDAVVISAALEPAYEVAGDALDYALAGQVAHLSIFDAMGHDLSAGLTASIAVASSRNNRRQGAGLVETSEAIDAAVAGQFDRTRYATGILAQLDTETGLLSWVDRGHPPPLLIRQGRWISSLECQPGPPMGLGLGIAPVLCHDQLEPGDRLLLYTDGVTEARRPRGHERFGLDRFADFIIRSEADGLSAPETLRRLIQAVLSYHDGSLSDDAAVLLVEWHAGADRQRVL